jgi:hypothetical protein
MAGFLARSGNGGDALYQEFQQAWPRRFCREIYITPLIATRKEGAMEQKITLTLARADAEGLVKKSPTPQAEALRY